MANLYFLIIMVLQIIKPISISGGQPAILLPLCFVVFVSLIKDGLEDLKRHKSDNLENNSKVTTFDPVTKKEVVSRWLDLKVG
jgi:phospholipid-transporting ATPase